MDTIQGKKPAIVVQAQAVEVKATPQDEAAAEPQVPVEEPTALKEKKTPKSNADLLDSDIFGDLDAAEPDNEVVDIDATSLLDDEGVVDDASDSSESTGDGDETEEENIGVMTIYATKCLRCTHLIPELNDDTNPKGKEFKGCHYENGNEECPAQYAQIVVGIPVGKIVDEIIKAEESGDSEKLGAIYAKLAQKDETQQNEVHRRLALERTKEKENVEG